MLERLMTWDRELLIFLNELHSHFFDPVAFYLTKTEFWVPLYLYLLYLIFRDQRKNSWFIVGGLIVAIALADQITAGLMKPFFERVRPSHDPSLEGVIHLVNDYRGGLYGFASSHAANTTAVALVVYLALRSTYRLAWTIFLWAAVMSYTRIYLGVHYPGDLLVGALVGLLSGFTAYKLQGWVKGKIEKRKTITEIRNS